MLIATLYDHLALRQTCNIVLLKGATLILASLLLYLRYYSDIFKKLSVHGLEMIDSSVYVYYFQLNNISNFVIDGSIAQMSVSVSTHWPREI